MNTRKQSAGYDRPAAQINSSAVMTAGTKPMQTEARCSDHMEQSGEVDMKSHP